MLRRKLKARLPERKDPGDTGGEWCSPGSIEQQLDMCEEGELRGDEILHAHGITDEGLDPLLQADSKTGRFRLLADPDREEDEMSGDDHSLGMQGEEFELQHQPHIDSGIPGEESEKEELISRTRTPLD